MKKILTANAVIAFIILIPLFGNYQTKLIKLNTTGDLLSNFQGSIQLNIYYSLYAICIWKNVVFSAGAENSIKSWTILDRGELKLNYDYKEAHASAFCGETITALSCSESMLLSVGSSKQIRLWHIIDKDGKLELLHAISNAHQRCIRAVCFYRNNIFFSASDDGSIKSWHINSNNEFEVIDDYQNAHNSPIRSIVVYKNNLISISEDDIIRIWEITEHGQLELTSYLFFNKHGKILDALCTHSGFLVIKFLKNEQQFCTKVWLLDDDILRTLTSESIADNHRINYRSNCDTWEINCPACNPPSKLTYYGNIIFSLENQFWIEAYQIQRQKITQSRSRNKNFSKDNSVKNITKMFKTRFKFK